jgi:hypothetical protein
MLLTIILVVVCIGLFLFMVAFGNLLNVFMKKAVDGKETDTERRIRELNLPMRKKWQRGRAYN